MQLEELYESIIGNITEEGKFTFGSETLGEAGNLLEDYFKEMMGDPVFEISRAACSPPENNSLFLCGTQDSENVNVQARFYVQESVLYMELSLSFLQDEDMEFFPGIRIRTREAMKKYRFRLDEKAKVNVEKRGVLLEDFTYTQLISIILQGLAAEENNLSAVPILREIRLTVKNVYEAGIDKTRVKAESDAVLHITDKLEAGDFSIDVVRSDTAYGLALKGEILFCKKTLPVVLYAQEGGFTFGIQAKSEDVGELALKDLLEFVDAPFAESIPDYFSVLTNIRLRRLLFFLAPGLGALRAAEIEISSPEEWKFLGTDALKLKDLSVSFSLEFLQECMCTAQIFGTLSVGSFDMKLCGTKEQDGFTFRGQMAQNSELHLKKAAEMFAESFGVRSMPLPIPDIRLKFAFVSFSTSEKNGKPFQLSAFVDVREDNDGDERDIAKKLLNIKAQIKVESVLDNGVRTYGGSLEGWLQISGQVFAVSYVFGGEDSSRIEAGWKSDTEEVSLVSLLEEFHVSEIPEAVRSISIGLQEVSISYHIEKKEMALTLSNRQYGTFSAYIWKDTKEQFQYALQFDCTKALELSELPVVGKDFQLLDTVRITEVGLSAASADYGIIKIGVSLSGNLEAGDSKYPFALDIENNPKQRLKESANEETSAGPGKWFDIYKNLGIFSLRRIAVTYQKGAVGFLLDASLAAAPFGISLLGIGLGFELDDPSRVHFFLSGLGVSYTSQALGINGAFSANADQSYAGELLIKIGEISLFAVGSYQDKSLFAYALLSAQIGGPPAFFVTGIAGGFGYNRSLQMPEIEAVSQFPMIRAAYGALDRSAMITELRKYILVSSGANFLAAGIRFDSFKIADSFALCTASFGNRLEIAVLGLSEISVPAHVRTEPIAYAQLALKAVCIPEEGVVSVMAELTRESYILSRSCKITGGFAFYLWFGGIHKGDFVITLGGYHPAYQKPEHYPSVPRLGFQWCVTPSLTISGELYFAVTPRCLMAGGALNAVYQSGNLRAWFRARVDFLIGWKPFYYDASLYIGLGASYRMNLLFCHVTVSAELSAGLHIWGPDFSGEAKISWFIISFTIRFGSSVNEKKYIDWDEFEESFLTSGQENVYGIKREDAGERKIHTVSYTGGLLRQSETEGAFVDSDTLQIGIRSKVPVTELRVNGKAQELKQAPLGVLPMGENRKLYSSCKIRVTDSAGVEQDIVVECLKENVPGALWGISDTGLNGAGLIEQVCVGARLSLAEKKMYETLPEAGWLDMEGLAAQIERTFSWNHPVPLSGPEYPQQDTIGEFARTADAKEVKQAREKLLSQWQEAGFVFDAAEISLQKLSQQSQDLFMEDICLQSFV